MNTRIIPAVIKLLFSSSFSYIAHWIFPGRAVIRNIFISLLEIYVSPTWVYTVHFAGYILKSYLMAIFECARSETMATLELEIAVTP